MTIEKKEKMAMYLVLKTQVQVKALLFYKALINVLAKFFTYSNIFSVENTVKFSEYIRINKHVIKLEKDK